MQVLQIFYKQFDCPSLGSSSASFSTFYTLDQSLRFPGPKIIHKFKIGETVTAQ